MAFKCIALVLDLVFLALAEEPERLELKAVFVIVQNGFSTPEHFYPKDTNSDSSNWPDGLNVLDSIGKSMVNQSSVYEMQQSTGFITGLSHYRMHAWAASNKASQQTAKIWIDWQTKEPGLVSVTTKSMLDVNLTSCPKAEKIYNKWVESQVAKDSVFDSKELEKLESETGEKYLNETEGLHRLALLASTIEAEKRANLKVPEWAQDEEKLDQWRNESLYDQWNNAELQRLLAGPVINHLVESIKAQVNQSPEQCNVTLLQVYTVDPDLYTLIWLSLDGAYRALGGYNPAGTIAVQLWYNPKDQSTMVEVSNSYTRVTKSFIEHKRLSLTYKDHCAHDKKFKVPNKLSPVTLCKWQELESLFKQRAISEDDQSKECKANFW